MHRLLRRGQLQDEHVLGEPALVARHRRCDPEREALLAEQRVAAVAGSVGPDFAGLRKVNDVLLGVARPADIVASSTIGIDERVADRVHGRNEITVIADLVESRLAHAGHDAHVHDDVGRVGDLDAELRDARADRAHRERDDVHGAAAHRTVEQALESAPHLAGLRPVVRRAGIDLLLRADEGAVLDAGDVARAGAGQEGVRTDLGVELDEGASGDHLLRQARPLILGPIAPHDAIGLGQFGHLLDPFEQLLIAGGGILQTRNAHVDSKDGGARSATSGKHAPTCPEIHHEMACKRFLVTNCTGVAAQSSSVLWHGSRRKVRRRQRPPARSCASSPSHPPAAGGCDRSRPTWGAVPPPHSSR
ncbi:unannotated protein [freshwater metagenome]|uniref:Unannotated protein n=1 Tax=freshwater metagenome TaxID=449393 RepID=A0A6J7IZC7_9ZZZZ